jgi:hypothetical protein
MMLPVPRALRLVVAFLAALVCALATSTADAHEAGLSRGRYELRDARVAAHLVFANVELANALPALDVDHGGTLSPTELDTGHAVLAQELARRLTVTADGHACPVSLASATLTEQDGVDVGLEAQCDGRPAKLVIHCGFLEVLSSSHHHWAVVSTEQGKDRPETMLVAANVDLVIDVGAAPSATSGFLALSKLGIEHILTGYDHLVFLFGLILLGGRTRSLVAALTAFTLAHSISLALAVLGVWAPSPAIVEPAIALSIAYVGVENLWMLRRTAPDDARADDAARGRWRITFPFGLVHGFGFAGALAEIGLPRARVPGALVAFNLGVELGQLAVLAVVLPLLLWARRHAFVRGRATTAANVVIVIAGVIWFVDRVRG